MIHTFKTLIFLATMTMFASCDKTVTYSKSLDNQTDETITLNFVVNGNESTMSVPPNSLASTIIDEQDGDIDSEYSCTSEFESIQATVSNNKLLTLNILDESNWIRQGGDDVDCLITITQADIQ